MLTGGLLATLGWGKASAAAARGPSGARYPLNTGWRFGEYVAGAADPGFDDAHFAPVTLPHSVVNLSWRDWDPSAWQRVWAYRRHVPGPIQPNTRLFLDFDAAMVSATVSCNGNQLAAHAGGYLPFSVELTEALTETDNVLAVVLDSTWQAVPPEGSPAGTAAVDFLEPGGIYRDVSLRLVPSVFIADVFAKPLNVLTDARSVAVQVTVDAAVAASGTVRTELLDNGRVLAGATTPISASPGTSTVTLDLTNLGRIALWSPERPRLYDVRTTLSLAGASHEYRNRIGFREATFTVDGFRLNGKPYKVFGLNRHQIYPYAGLAMPARVQRRDAQILREDLNCNMVRCSHYPQSPHFLDACDELGLLVWQEPPGWHYLGDAAWQDLAVRNVHDMIVRDRSRPSVILWGIRLNETANDPALYARTAAVAAQLDGSRQTSGAMDIYSTDNWSADVFAFDDYHTDPNGHATLLPPLPNVPYLVTEAVGALDGAPYYRWTDTQQVLATQLIMHATVHDIARGNDRYAGLLGWAGFDYDSLNGHIYRNVKWPGVIDTFRVPKPGAGFYQSQVDPQVRPVIAPGFFWDFGPSSPAAGPGPNTVIATNCERLELYVDGQHHGTALPDHARFPNLRYPPAFADLTVSGAGLPELRIDGYVGNRVVTTKTFASDPGGDRLSLVADDLAISADGSDATRVVFRALDAYGNQRPYVSDSVALRVTGPAILVGDNPFAFADFGGVGAVWLRSIPSRPGPIRLTASHPTLGSATVLVLAR
ncbi:MAG TPA: glycoside hydrolase family 2 TIM barrel-domain containing protein [Pseudonocardiaceae bacterium]|nr:glycoside hydrolase family 2 TIM barrel-domain containing protein [Pseudonocardiaceae bacterium]